MQLYIWNIVSLCVSAILSLLMLYQIIYIFVGLFAKIRYPETADFHSYGVIICARNERNVIGRLVESIRKQNYPQEKLRIFVIADNCDDDTAFIARGLGCEVFERHDLSHIGKSYALDFILRAIADGFPDYKPDGWFFFDADNLLELDYIREMNKCFAAGNKIVTSYRNSKNFGSSMWSMGASVHFIRECRFVHAARSKLGVSTHVSGTGFLIASDVINFADGWNYRRMTEDVEFSVSEIVRGRKIAYCDSAIFYDEQPTSRSQTFRQRLRWQKGNYQVVQGYSAMLLKNMFKTGKFVFFDMAVYFTVSLLMAVWTVASFVLGNLFVGIDAAAEGTMSVLSRVGVNVAVDLVTCYAGLFVFGSLAVVKDWNRIRASRGKKIVAILLYPVFMICVLPVTVLALFTKTRWRPISHTDDVSIEELCEKPLPRKKQL